MCAIIVFIMDVLNVILKSNGIINMNSPATRGLRYFSTRDS
jgi:hypothetical protein